jgi:M6 family metalloprotease-like protein
LLRKPRRITMRSVPRVIAAGLLLTPALFLLAFPVLSLAQDSPRTKRLRALTSELTQTNGETTAGSQPELRQKKLSLIRERAELLYSLIAENPYQAAALSLTPEVAKRLRTQFPEVAEKLESHPSLESPVVVLVEDNLAPSKSRTLVRMQEQPGKPLVYFASRAPSGLKSGVVLRIRGVQIDDHIVAVESKLVSADTSAQACTTTGAQKTAVLMVNFPGEPVPALTKDTVSSVFFSSTQRSLDSFWRENSYNQMSASGDVFGSYTLDRAYTCDEPAAMWNAAIQAADADLDFTAYTRYFVIFPTIQNCSFTGLGTVGCGTWNSPSRGAFAGSVAWEPSSTMNTQDGGVSLSAHEGGHGLGLAHSRELTFSGEVLGPVGTAGSTIEYGDPYPAMAYNPGQYAAPHKALLGWLAPGSSYNTVETSGVYTIDPIETISTGTKALKVRRGTGNNAWLWIEYRQPLGSSDTLLQGPSFSGAVIHYEDPTTFNYTDLLDFAPQTSTANDAPLAAWSDPYSDLTILALSATSTGLTVSIQYGPQSGCYLVIPSVNLATDSTGVPPGGNIDYLVTVQNNDTASCLSPRTFSLTSPQPDGWGTSYSSSSVTLAPQQSTSATLTKSVPAATTPQIALVTAAAADVNNSGSGTATLIVAGMQTPQPISVTPSGGTGNPVSFAFTFSDADGWANIVSTQILFNPSGALQNSCFILYEPDNSRFFLADDNNSYLGPVALGDFQILENSQCRISGAGSSAVGSGTNLTLTLAMSFKPSYIGATNIYLEAQNYYVQGARQQYGSWTITAPQLPAAASAPTPSDGSAAVSVTPVLTWMSGAGATWYDVYFGTSPSPPFQVSTSATSFNPGTLSQGTTYYWRIVATNAAGATSSPVWSFTTAVGPDFSLAVAPAAQSWTAGGSAQYTTTVAALNGFTGNVSLAATGLPAGATAAFSPISVSGGAGSSALTVTTSASTPAGTYTANVTGVSGNISHNASFTLSVQVATTLSLAAAGGPFSYGQPVLLTATITPSTATGAIQFTDGTSPLGTASISGGTAALTVTSLSVGTHQINAAYPGNGNYLASNTGIILPISQATSSAALASSLNPAPLGQAVTLTATISPSSATGSVQFLDGTTSLGTGTLSGGSATLAVSTLALGTHSITASYSGDANSSASTSPVLTQTIGPEVTQPVSVTPSGGTGNPGTFTFVFSDTNGWASILSTAILFNNSVAFQNACHVLYEPGNNRFFLADDGETTYLGPVTLGAFQVLENSQCRISGAGSSAVGSGNNLTLTLAISFKASYVGPTNIFMEAQNFYVQGTWQQMGSWTITAPQAPAAPSAPSPGDGTAGATASTVLSWTAGAGATWYDVYFGTSPSPAFLVSTAALNFSPGTLAPGTKYYWRVISTSAAGATSSPVWSFTTTLAVTSVAISSSLNPAVMGQSVAFTAAVSPNTATGTVQFLDGATSLGVAIISGGSASLAVSSLAAGAHSITAVYSGDATNAPSTSSPLTQNVSKLTPSVVLSSSQNPSGFGQSVTLTARLSPNAATGTVQFLDGTTALGTATISGGAASIPIATLSVGTHSIAAVYSGDGSYNSSTSGALGEVVNKAASAVTISSSANPSNAAQSVTFSAAISPATATGSVQFLDRGTVLGTTPVNAGSASLTTSTLASGVHSISAVYSGSASFNGSSASLTQVVKQATTSALTANRTAIAYGQSVQFTATVSPTSAKGTVQFVDGSKSLGTGTLKSGAATLSVSALSAGTHSVSAVYSGDASDSSSTSNARTVTVAQATASITIASSTNPSLVGAAVKFTANVSPDAATGTVQFSADSRVLGTATLSGGVASLTTSTLAADTYSITAVFSGDVDYSTATSSVLQQRVDKSATTTSMTSSVNPSNRGQSVTFTASVSPASATGTIQFLDGSAVLSTVNVSAGKAAWTMKPSFGNHYLKAVYSGDPADQGSTSATLKQDVD